MLVAVLFVGHAHRLLARGANQHHVADGDGAFLLGNAALDVLLRIGAHVLLHHHDVFHQYLALGGAHAQHATFLALVAPADHPHIVVAANIHDLMHVSQTLWLSAISRQLLILLALFFANH